MKLMTLDEFKELPPCLCDVDTFEELNKRLENEKLELVADFHRMLSSDCALGFFCSKCKGRKDTKNG
jgi:hypothetical protein